MNIKNRKKFWATGIILLLSIFVCSMTGCKSPDSPDVIRANISVSNECGLAIDVYMDGSYQFTLEFLEYATIQSVAEGVYEIVAKKKDTGEVITTEIVNVNAFGEIWVSILSAASIKIINQYGETLNIYTNGSLQGELVDDYFQVFYNVPYGEHVLEASKTSDNTLVASITISVVEEKEYTWTVR
jgi:hypothetical protein